MARRAVRVADLFQRDRFAAKLGEVLDFHNFVLQHYYRAPTVDFQKTLDAQLAMAEQIAPLVTDVTLALHQLRATDANVLFEGAQGAMLDVDHRHLSVRHLIQHHRRLRAAPARGWVRAPSTPCSASSRPTPRASARVPFPTELFDEYGEHLSRVGHEFGSVTGRRRRCGWFDSVALRRSIVNSSVSGLCITKLDVLDGLDTIRICVGYRINGGRDAGAADERRGLRRRASRCTRSCPAGASRRSASPPTRRCRRTRAATSSAWSAWSTYRST